MRIKSVFGTGSMASARTMIITVAWKEAWTIIDAL